MEEEKRDALRDRFSDKNKFIQEKHKIPKIYYDIIEKAVIKGSKDGLIFKVKDSTYNSELYNSFYSNEKEEEVNTNDDIFSLSRDGSRDGACDGVLESAVQNLLKKKKEDQSSISLQTIYNICYTKAFQATHLSREYDNGYVSNYFMAFNIAFNSKWEVVVTV